MPLRSLARAYYRRQARITRMAQEAARQVWRGVQIADLDRSWARVAEQMTVTVAAAQLLAAQGAEPYVADMLADQGADNDREHTFAPRSVAGVASDGRRLDALLFTPVIEVKQAVAAPSAPPEVAMARGEASLLRIVGTQVPDAGRVATGVVIAATPSITKWVRMINPGACGRCAILAGRVYVVSQGFERHENCSCVHIPLSENVKNDITTSPRKYFDSLTRAEQNTLFGAARTERILAGEDINQVVNSGRRATRTASAARPSRTARSLRARKAMPEQVVSGASSRAEAIAALRAAGFLT
jgi:hypothetical protein